MSTHLPEHLRQAVEDAELPSSEGLSTGAALGLAAAGAAALGALAWCLWPETPASPKEKTAGGPGQQLFYVTDTDDNIRAFAVMPVAGAGALGVLYEYLNKPGPIDLFFFKYQPSASSSPLPSGFVLEDAVGKQHSIQTIPDPNRPDAIGKLFEFADDPNQKISGPFTLVDENDNERQVMVVPDPNKPGALGMLVSAV